MQAISFHSYMMLKTTLTLFAFISSAVSQEEDKTVKTNVRFQTVESAATKLTLFY